MTTIIVKIVPTLFWTDEQGASMYYFKKIWYNIRTDRSTICHNLLVYKLQHMTHSRAAHKASSQVALKILIDIKHYYEITMSL